MYNLYASFVSDKAIESRPTFIRARGMYLHISYILKLPNGISVLNVSAGLKIALCGHNLNYRKTKQYAIWQLELQIWTAKRSFPQSKRKRWKKKQQKKIARVWPSYVYLVEMEVITSRITRKYKEKKKSIFDRGKWKKKRAVGRRNPGPNQWITP